MHSGCSQAKWAMHSGCSQAKWAMHSGCSQAKGAMHSGCSQAKGAMLAHTWTHLQTQYDNDNDIHTSSIRTASLIEQ
jgi:hypothetical protein